MRRPRTGKDVFSIVKAMDHTQLHIVTYNIHKGFSQFHQHLMVHELREQLRELPLHEQIDGSLTENDVTEILTGEVTPESREVVEDLYADLQEEEADRQAEERRD